MKVELDLMIIYCFAGTTWIQEIINLVQNAGNSSEIPIYVRHTFIECHFPCLPAEFDKWVSGSHTGIVQTHLSSGFFEKTLEESQAKFIVVLRNPKDMLVSYYNFYRMNKLYNFSGSWDDFFKMFKDKKLSHGDYFDVQLSWWKLRDDPRILILKYEDMQRSPEDMTRKVMNHLEISLSDDIVDEIAKKTSFAVMKDNPLLNYTGIPIMKTEISPFMRKGIVGDWRNYFSKEQSDYVDKLSDAHFKFCRLFLKEK